jgi:hypothetical protein
MKIAKWIMICLLAVMLAPVGCGKKQADNKTVRPPGSIDVSKLRDAFATASPELKAMCTQAIRGIEAANYVIGLSSLEKLAAAPDLNEPQKQAVAEMLGQVQQKAAGAAAAPAQ